MIKAKKLPRDAAQRARAIVDLAIGEITAPPPEEKDVARQLAGSKGGRARAAALTSAERRVVARKGSAARWRAARKPKE